MRLSITAKLFLAFLVTNITIAAAFAIANQISVNRGFREFVQLREERELKELADDLAIAYLEQGQSWDFVRTNPDAWPRLTQRSMRRPPPRLLADRGLVPPPDRGPLPDEGRGPPRSVDWMPPHPPGSEPPHLPGMNPGHPDKSAPGRPGPPPPSMPVRYTLLDPARNVLAGAALGNADETTIQPIVAQDHTVGWVAAQGPQFAGADLQFLREQLRSSWIIAALALLIAACVSIFMARGFLAPIRRLAKATHRLAKGDYAQRVTPSSRDELGQLVEDFNGLAARLQDVETSRRAFLADVSHELRTPLAVLRAELEALQDGLRSLTPEAIRSLQAEVATLGVLIDDLYDLALADLGGAVYRKVPLDLTRVVRTALNAFTARFDERRLAVDSTGIAAEPVTIAGEERRLTQLLNNLFENTRRYTDPGGRVSIAVARDGAFAVLDLQDSAPGVPQAALPRLFDRLFRVESSRSRDSGGAGLGLSLCRSIVEGHGGEIDVMPSPLGGLWVRVRLPLAGTP